MSDEKSIEAVDERLADNDNGIDRIRQILFGEQIAKIESRFKTDLPGLISSFS